MAWAENFNLKWVVSRRSLHVSSMIGILDWDYEYLSLWFLWPRMMLVSESIDSAELISILRDHIDDGWQCKLLQNGSLIDSMSCLSSAKNSWYVMMTMRKNSEIFFDWCCCSLHFFISLIFFSSTFRRLFHENFPLKSPLVGCYHIVEQNDGAQWTKVES